MIKRSTYKIKEHRIMAHPVLPEGEQLRRAVRWIGEQRAATPSIPLIQLLEEACRQFDLSPKEGDFLINFFTRPVEKQSAGD